MAILVFHKSKVGVFWEEFCHDSHDKGVCSAATFPFILMVDADIGDFFVKI